MTEEQFDFLVSQLKEINEKLDRNININVSFGESSFNAISVPLKKEFETQVDLDIGDFLDA